MGIALEQSALSFALRALDELRKEVPERPPSLSRTALEAHFDDTAFRITKAFKRLPAQKLTPLLAAYLCMNGAELLGTVQANNHQDVLHYQLPVALGEPLEGYGVGLRMWSGEVEDLLYDQFPHAALYRILIQGADSSTPLNARLRILGVDQIVRMLLALEFNDILRTADYYELKPLVPAAFQYLASQYHISRSDMLTVKACAERWLGRGAVGSH